MNREELLRAARFSLCATGIVLLTVILSMNGTAFCKTKSVAEQVDSKIASLLQTMDKAETTPDANFQVSDRLLSYLKRVCRNPQLLSAPLNRASQSGLNLVTASDRKLRIYNWDTPSGGTGHYCYSLIQYQANDRNKAETLVLSGNTEQKSPHSAGQQDPGWNYSSLSILHTHDGKTVYLAMGSAVYSTRDRGECIQAYSIENGQLRKMPFFQTAGRSLSEITCNFTADSESAIELADKEKILKIPEVDSKGVATGKYLLYSFDGHKFVARKLMGNSAHASR